MSTLAACLLGVVVGLLAFVRSKAKDEDEVQRRLLQDFHDMDNVL